MSEILDGKVNSESVSNENSFEKKIIEFRNKGEGSFLVFVEGPIHVSIIRTRFSSSGKTHAQGD
jgi:hypothetical protein